MAGMWLPTRYMLTPGINTGRIAVVQNKQCNGCLATGRKVLCAAFGKMRSLGQTLLSEVVVSSSEWIWRQTPNVCKHTMRHCLCRLREFHIQVHFTAFYFQYFVCWCQQEPPQHDVLYSMCVFMQHMYIIHLMYTN